MATYPEIKNWIKNNKKYGFTAKDCWIAHVKELCGRRPMPAPSRIKPRKNPCPPDKVEPIKDALKHFKMI